MFTCVSVSVLGGNNLCESKTTERQFHTQSYITLNRNERCCYSDWNCLCCGISTNIGRPYVLLHKISAHICAPSGLSSSQSYVCLAHYPPVVAVARASPKPCGRPKEIFLGGKQEKLHDDSLSPHIAAVAGALTQRTQLVL